MRLHVDAVTIKTPSEGKKIKHPQDDLTVPGGQCQ